MVSKKLSGSPQPGYASPEAEVIVITERSVLCQSGGTEEFINGNTEDWF